VAAHQEAFLLRYGANLPLAGTYTGNLSNGGERLKLAFGAGAPVIEFSYDDEAGWPEASDGEGASLQLGDLTLSEGDLSLPALWVAGPSGGTPGEVGNVMPPPTDGEKDSDGDGMTDEAEGVAGTDPQDPLDFLRVTAMAWSAEGLRIEWASVVGKTYAVEYVDRLEKEWTVVGQVSAEAVRSHYLEDGMEAKEERLGGGQGYYRIRVQEGE
jgi:hypothetical protein